jgi:hypothetical protein
MIKYKRLLLIFTLIFLVSGCSFRFVYNHLDWWTNWYLDDYVSLTNEQQDVFDQKFEQLHTWHRKSQLPLYAQQLKAIKRLINEGINSQNVEDNLDYLAEHWRRFLVQTEPLIQPLVFQLSAAQKKELSEALIEINQERRDDYEDIGDEEWFEERVKDQQAQLKEWFGRLTKAQKSQVKIMSQDYQRSFEPWISYRERWTNEFSTLLNGELPEHQFKFVFYRLIVNGRDLRGDNLKAISAHNTQVFSRIFEYMCGNLTDKQLKKINKKINKVIGDLEYLAKQ